MHTHTTSKRIMAAIILCSHSLMSCLNPAVEKTNIHKIKPQVPQIYTASYNGQKSRADNESALVVKNDATRKEAVNKPAGSKVSTSKKNPVFPKHSTVVRSLTPGITAGQKYKDQLSDQPISTHPIHPSKIVANQKTLQLIEKQLVGKTYCLRSGTSVRFYREDNRLKGKVYEKLGNFRRKLDMQVYIGEAVKKIVPRNIHIINPEKAADKKGRIWIGHGGLRGGMMDPNDNNSIIAPQKFNTKSKEEIAQFKFKEKLIEKSFIKALKKIKQNLDKTKSPTCFLSYAWHPKQADDSLHPLDARVHQIARYLRKAGIQVYLDKKDNHVGTSIGEFVRLIDQVDYVIWMGSVALYNKCSDANLARAREVEFGNKPLAKDESISVMSREAVRIKHRLETKGKGFLLPACLEENHLAVFPFFARDLASEPLQAWPNYKAIFQFLKVMVPNLEADIKKQKKAFEKDQAEFEKELRGNRRAGYIEQMKKFCSVYLPIVVIIIVTGILLFSSLSFSTTHNQDKISSPNNPGVIQNEFNLGKEYMLPIEQDEGVFSNICEDYSEVNQDFREASTYFAQEVDQEDAVEQYKLGLKYYQGDRVTIENQEALAWFQKSAIQGYAAAQNKLGTMYKNGYGVKQAYTKAFEWYQKAANQEYAESAYNLGIMYDNGEGVEKDANEALTWYKRAASGRNREAQNELSKRYPLRNNLVDILQKSETELDISSKQLTSSDILGLVYHPLFYQKKAQYKTLDLRSNNLGDEGMKALASHLPQNLVSLNLSGNQIGYEGAQALSPHLPQNLVSLNLSGNQIGYRSLNALSPHLPQNLESLDLGSNQIGYRSLNALSPHLPQNLVFLNLSGNQIGYEGVQALAPHLPKVLKCLFLRSNKLGDEGVKVLAPHLPQNIEALDLSSNNLGYEGLKFLAPHLPQNLVSLNLSGNQIGYRSIKILSLYLPQNLVSLNLSGNQIGYAGLKFLTPHLSQNLGFLDLSDTNLGDEGVKALSPHLPQNLVSLNLSGNQIGYEGAQALSPHLPQNLVSLDLSGNQIGYRSLKALFPHLPQNLVSLNLSGNQIGDEGLKVLSPHLPQNLESLDLRSNKLDYEGMKVIKELRTRLPNLIVRYDY